MSDDTGLTVELVEGRVPPAVRITGPKWTEEFPLEMLDAFIGYFRYWGAKTPHGPRDGAAEALVAFRASREGA